MMLPFVDIILTFFTLIGGIIVLNWLLTLIWKVFRSFLPQENLLTRYGDGNKYKIWALVTGGTDGIGLGYCEVLA